MALSFPDRIERRSRAAWRTLYVEALGGRLDLIADFGDRTVRLPVSDAAPNAAA